MKISKSEKEWFRQLNGKSREEAHQPVAEQAAARTAKHVARVPKGKGLADVAGMADLKRMVKEGFIDVLQHKDCAAAYGIRPPSMLFYGPAGCGKTYFAEKVAEEVGIHFMKVVPDDLASTLVHGSQEKIGELFRKAEKHSPMLLFFDEFDAMVPARSNDERNYQNGEVNEFLCMLNNAADRGIYVLAATNHPERIDKAVLRTGRIDELIYVGMPDAAARAELFRLSLSRLPSEEDIDYEQLARLAEGFNCSDIDYIVKVASRKMFNLTISQEEASYARISQRVLEEAIARQSPSVTMRDLKEYERVRSELQPKKAGAQRRTIGFHI